MIRRVDDLCSLQGLVGICILKLGMMGFEFTVCMYVKYLCVLPLLWCKAHTRTEPTACLSRKIDCGMIGALDKTNLILTCHGAAAAANWHWHFLQTGLFFVVW